MKAFSSLNETVDLKQAEKFLTFLDKNSDRFSFQIFDDKTCGSTMPKIYHGSFEKHRDIFMRQNTQQTAGIFVTVNQTDLCGRRAENITAIRAYFIDLDDPIQAPLQTIFDGPLEPHLVVQSSSIGKYHVYWLIENAPIKSFSLVQEKLIQRFHGDPKVKDLGRVMRLPGFFHHKKDRVRTNIVFESTKSAYFYEEFLQAFQIDVSKKKIVSPDLLNTGDKILQAIQEKGLYIESIQERPGGHRILCPWKEKHTTGNGGTAYFQAHANGYLGAGFICHHAHCSGKNIENLRQFLGLKKESSNRGKSTAQTRNLSQIYIKGGELTPILNRAEQALLTGNCDLYQRNGMLVRMVIKQRILLTGVMRAESLIAIQPVEVPFLVEVFTREIEWYLSDARQKGDRKWKKSDCPERLAKIFIARGEWKLPLLQGVITAPTLRADGSVLDQEGYDAKTGLFFHSNEKFLPLKAQPKMEDAIAAIAIFKDLLKDFLFIDSASFSVAISAILTALIRRSLITAPLHAFNAPKKGSGKSLLADVVGIIATGFKPTLMSQPENQTEERKRLLSLLMVGDPVICIDNVERPLGSDALCTILTSERWSERLLGANKNIDVSTNVMFLATGNNIIFQGDLTRRVLKSTIDPKCERPEERKFDVDLQSYSKMHRALLVDAGLTILKAYDFAGRPSQNLPQLGSFEQWSSWVRSALIWSGLQDPCETRNSIEDKDPISRSLKRLLMIWHREFKEPVLARVVLGRAGSCMDLREAIEELVGDPLKIGTKKFGNCLQKYQNRREGSLCFVQRGTNQGAVLWGVKKT